MRRFLNNSCKYIGANPSRDLSFMLYSFMFFRKFAQKKLGSFQNELVKPHVKKNLREIDVFETEHSVDQPRFRIK